MADFVATTSGSSASGYLIANGQVYPAVSGGPFKQRIPEGTNTFGSEETLKADQVRGMSDGTGNKGGFRKFHIGTGPKGMGNIPDPTLGRDREGIDFHYDGGSPGTSGCIGYQDRNAQQALEAELGGKNATGHVTTTYVKDMDAVHAEIEKKLGHKVDWSKIQAVKPPAKGPGPRSTTKKGKKVQKGDQTVLLGSKKRHTAHKKAPLVGGGQVTHASHTVHVGRKRHKVARVADATTDGPIATGEPTILVG